MTEPEGTTGQVQQLAVYRYIRHPNYLCEMMLYSSLALMVWHWLPGVILAWLRGGLFAVYMATTAASRCASPSGRSTSDARGGCYPRFGKQARGAAARVATAT